VRDGQQRSDSLQGTRRCRSFGMDTEILQNGQCKLRAFLSAPAHFRHIECPHHLIATVFFRRGFSSQMSQSSLSFSAAAADFVLGFRLLGWVEIGAVVVASGASTTTDTATAAGWVSGDLLFVGWNSGLVLLRSCKRRNMWRF
jgi:hypothetical protein